MTDRLLTYSQAIREAIIQSMEKDEKVILIGEGVPDPKGIFGTTLGLRDKFGENRVFDMPLAENGMTGICIGAALYGYRPILTHQRLDFALLSMDQIVNNAAKWHYMFGGQKSVPLVIRMIIGRGWGQGAQHSQNLQALFAHIPGLKVVMPSTAYDAKGMMISAIKDNNPVIFIEHRWLHNIKGYVPEEMYDVQIGKAKVICEGKDLTLVATSYMVVEAVKAVELSEQSVEIVDVRTLSPLDKKTIIESVQKTGKLLVMDSGYGHGGFAAELIAVVCENVELKHPPSRITLPDCPTPTSHGLSKYYYPSIEQVIHAIGNQLSVDLNHIKVPLHDKHDIPDKSFTGPF